jgi:hypothetical protein
MRPLMYGYMRMPQHAPEAVVRGWCETLRDYADHEGFDLASVFYEGDSGGMVAYSSLLDEMQSRSSRDVVVLTSSHVHPHRAVREMRIDMLVRQLGATLHVVDLGDGNDET